MAALLVTVVCLGFGRTLDARLIHPASPRPRVLYVHAILFTSWVALFVLQVVLIRLRRVTWHRRVGRAGIALGAAMLVVGVATALATTRANPARQSDGVAAFLIVPLFDMVAFAVTFGLAVWWRRRPEYHRRLMLMATCGLAAAAFARFPNWLVPPNAWYGATDLLILVAAARDRRLERRVHPVYSYGLPLLMLGQGIAMTAYLGNNPAWIVFARSLIH